MGEIRSTLDIIMEKTKGLTMSEEEKKALKEQEMSGKVKGLIQQYLDGILDMDKLKIEVVNLAEPDEDMVKRMIRRESMPRIGLEKNNEPILALLRETTGIDAEAIRGELKRFENKLEQERIRRKKGLIKALEVKGISGTAVIPNIKTDPEWDRYVSGLKKGLQDQLSLFIEEMTNS
jgi:hypothetical protein